MYVCMYVAPQLPPSSTYAHAFNLSQMHIHTHTYPPTYLPTYRHQQDKLSPSSNSSKRTIIESMDDLRSFKRSLPLFAGTAGVKRKDADDEEEEQEVAKAAVQ